MRLRRLRFEGFGRFNRGLDGQFEPGMNVVLGPNESGKSTIVAGILAVLFGYADAEGAAAFRPRGVYGAYTGELELTTPDGEYHIARDFEARRVLVTRRDPAGNVTLYQGEADPLGRAEDYQTYLEILEELTGLKDRAMAGRTLFLTQDGLEAAIDERIRHLLSGNGTGGYDRVAGHLERRYFRISRDNPWGRRKSRPRELDEIGEHSVELEQRLERARETLNLGGRLVVERIETTEALARSRGEAEEKALLHDSYLEFMHVTDERTDLEKRLRIFRDEKEKVKGLSADVERARADLWPRYELYRNTGPELGETLRTLGAGQRELTAMAEELARRETALAGAPWPRTFRVGLIAGGVTALATFIGLAITGQPIPGLGLGLVLGVAAFGGVQLVGKNKERLRITLEATVVELAERVERRRAELTAQENELKPIIGQRRLREVMEEFRDYRERADLLARYEQVRDSHRPLTEVEGDYDDVFRKLKLVDNRARDLIARAPYLAAADEDLEATRVRMEKARRERDEAQARVCDLSAQLDELKLRQARQEGAAAENVEVLAEELGECRERAAALAQRRDALREALDVLNESVGEFQESHLERLTQRASELMRRVTDGRWRRVVLTRDFVPALVPASGEEFSAGMISRGCRDQLSLTLRLAVIEEIQGGRALPLFLDDVLVNCDAARLSGVRRVLDEVTAAGRQVILFSHDESFAAWGRVAARLPGEEALVTSAA